MKTVGAGEGEGEGGLQPSSVESPSAPDPHALHHPGPRSAMGGGRGACRT